MSPPHRQSMTLSQQQFSQQQQPRQSRSQSQSQFQYAAAAAAVPSAIVSSGGGLPPPVSQIDVAMPQAMDAEPTFASGGWQSAVPAYAVKVEPAYEGGFVPQQQQQQRGSVALSAAALPAYVPPAAAAVAYGTGLSGSQGMHLRASSFASASSRSPPSDDTDSSGGGSGAAGVQVAAVSAVDQVCNQPLLLLTVVRGDLHFFNACSDCRADSWCALLQNLVVRAKAERKQVRGRKGGASKARAKAKSARKTGGKAGGCIAAHFDEAIVHSGTPGDSRSVPALVSAPKNRASCSLFLGCVCCRPVCQACRDAMYLSMSGRRCLAMPSELSSLPLRWLPSEG